MSERGVEIDIRLVRHLDLVNILPAPHTRYRDSGPESQPEVSRSGRRRNGRLDLPLRTPTGRSRKVPEIPWRHTLGSITFLFFVHKMGHDISAVTAAALPWTPCAAGDIRIGW